MPVLFSKHKRSSLLDGAEKANEECAKKSVQISGTRYRKPFVSFTLPNKMMVIVPIPTPVMCRDLTDLHLKNLLQGIS